MRSPCLVNKQLIGPIPRFLVSSLLLHQREQKNALECSTVVIVDDQTGLRQLPSDNITYVIPFVDRGEDDDPLTALQLQFVLRFWPFESPIVADERRTCTYFLKVWRHPMH